MYSNMTYEGYYLYKLWLTVIFENDLDGFNMDEWLKDAKGLDFFFLVVDHLNKKNFLSRKIKNSIYDIVGKIRWNNNTKEKTEILSKIITILNMAEDYIPIGAYRIELAKRRTDERYLKCNQEIIIDNIEQINDSITHDGYVMFSHSVDVNDEEFEEEYVDYLSNNEFYYESLNNILVEYPAMFKNELFYSRMIKVMEYEKQNFNNKENIRYNKKFLKKVDKVLRKVID